MERNVAYVQGEPSRPRRELAGRAIDMAKFLLESPAVAMAEG
jgi:hypothetical protein